MSTIDSVTSTTSSSSSSSSASEAVSSLDMDDFITLMTAQLQNQDPTNPTDANEYMSQLAQFATVSGVSEMNSSISDLTDQLRTTQAMDGASLIGRSVLVTADSMSVASGGTVQGAVSASSGSQNVTVSVTNSSGTVVRTIELGSGEGLMDFSWDGLTDSGEAAAAGTYTFEATADVGGTSQALDVMLSSTVDSVTIDSSAGEFVLNTADLGTIDLADVLQIQ